MTMASSAAAVGFGEQPDEVLVRQVLAGNTPLFELLMRRHNERVYRTARAIVRDELKRKTSCSRRTSTPSRT